jgi:type IV secretion system protein TrbF
VLSDSSFQVKWTEQVYERGSLASTTRWTAILTVVIRPPRNAEQLRRNPLGVFVNAVDWSRELESAAPTPVSPKEPANGE